MMDIERETPIVENGDGRISPIVIITNLGSGLPDPIENSSEDYDEDAGREGSVPMGPSSKPMGPKSPVQDPIPSNPRSLSGEPSFVPKLSDHVSGEESAGLLNNFINVPHGTSKATSSPSSVTSKISRLKRISKPSGSSYRGINASRGTQRRMNSRPVNVFDLGEENSLPLVNKNPVIRAHSVDPDSINWQTQDVLRQKKRKLNAPTTSKPAADLGAAANSRVVLVADEDVHISQPPASEQREPPKGQKRGRGRPRKSRPEDDDPVDDDVSNILPGSESAIPSLSSDAQIKSTANGDAVAELTIKDGKAGSSKPQQEPSTGKKRGRPPKPKPDDYKSIDSPIQNDTSPRPSGRKIGRPRKSGLYDNHPTVIADSEEQLDHTSKEHPPDFVEDVPPQMNMPGTVGRGQGTRSDVVDEDRGSNPPGSVNDAQESHLPLPVSADNASDKASPQASQGEKTTVPNQPESNGLNYDQKTQASPSEIPVDQVEPSTGGVQNTAQQDQPDRPADGSFGEPDQETQPASGPISESSLSEAFKAASEIGQNRQSHAVPPPKSKPAREVLQVCTAVRTCMSDIEAADQDDIPGLSAKLQRLLFQVWEKSRGLVLEPDWQRSGMRTHAIFMHILPRLAVLLKHMLRHFNCRIEKLSYKQLQTSRILMDAIVELGSEVKSVKPVVEFEFAVVKRVKQVIVKGIEQALKDVQNRIQRTDDARQAVVRAGQRREEQRVREQEERSLERRLKIFEDWKSRWDTLHSERTIAELTGRSFLTSWKQNHLRLIPLELNDTNVELDGNGDPIERVQLFGQRTTRPPGQGSGSRVQSWMNEDHAYALVKGLRDFSGPRVYQKIFWKYCQQGNPLCDYNVSEIVDQAMWLRQEIMQDDEENGNETADWVLQIYDPRVPPDLDDA